MAILYKVILHCTEESKNAKLQSVVLKIRKFRPNSGITGSDSKIGMPIFHVSIWVTSSYMTHPVYLIVLH